jgi:hypothetical protein
MSEKNDDKRNLAIDLANVVCVSQLSICQFSASTAHLRESIALGMEIGDELQEAVGHQILGRLTVIDHWG